MSWALGAVDGDGGALEGEVHGGAVGLGDMVGSLEEAAEIGIRGRLDGPVAGVGERG